MTRCEHYRPLILDHLYGLLDEPEEAAVDLHLRECASCASARAEAARVQGMIAKAARGAFPHVRFESPPSAPVKTLAPVPASRVAARRSSTRAAAWLPWAVAAAVLMALPGTILPVLGILDRATAARKQADDRAEVLASRVQDAERARQEVDTSRTAARLELAARTQALEGVLVRWVAAEKAGLAQARKTSVDVLKPASIQPGAPNEFQLVVRDGVHSPNRLMAEIHEVRKGPGGSTDAVIYSQPLAAQTADKQYMRIPASAWTRVSPQSELYLAVTSKDDLTNATTEIQERIRLYGPVFATMLVTDKPTYRPGETLYFRSLTLDRITFQPPEREQECEYGLFEKPSSKRSSAVASMVQGGTDLVRIEAGTVEPVLVNGKPVRGVGCGAISLPATLADGDYVLRLSERYRPGSTPTIPVPVVRPIKVRSGIADEFRKQTGFTAASYRPGDMVEAWAELYFRGQPVGNAEVYAVATADDVTFESIQVEPVSGPNGRVNLRFRLPADLERGDVRLKVAFKARVGQNVVEESVADRVPVVGRSVNVEFFPEGGNLVAGVPCRVYFRATTPSGQPVDLKGTITDGRKTLAAVETVTGASEGANRGLGSFTYVPELGTRAWLKLEAPAGLNAPLLLPSPSSFPVTASTVAGVPGALASQTGFVLPSPRPEGVVMTVLDPITEPGQAIRVHLRSVGTNRKLVVGAYTRGRLSDTHRLVAEVGQVAEVRLMANTEPRGGVVRITVFEEPEAAGEAAGPIRPDMIPVAERLVFRKPGESLQLSFQTSGPQIGGGFLAGGPVELSIAARDEKGNPAAAILYAAAVNSGVAQGPNDRLLTTHFLLAGEINTPDAMEHADFLLTDQPKAGEVLDLVLATQGWRRFAEQTYPGFIKRPEAPNADCAHLLVANGQYSVWSEPQALRNQQKQFATYWPQYEKAKQARDDAQAMYARLNADRTAEARAQEKSTLADQARAEAREAADRLARADAPVSRFQQAGWYGVAGFGALALLLGGLCLARPSVRLPLGIGTSGALGLVAFLVFSLGMAEQSLASHKTAEAASKAPATPALPGPRTETPDPPMPAPVAGIAKDTGLAETNRSDDHTDKVQDTRPMAVPVKPAISPGRIPKGTFWHPPAQLPVIGGAAAGAAADRGPPRPAPPGSGGGFGRGQQEEREKVKRYTETQITNDDLKRDMYRAATASVQKGTPHLMSPAPVPPLAGPAGIVSMPNNSHAADVKLAKEYLGHRTRAAAEQIFGAMARKQSIPAEEVKRAIENLKRGEGWTPKADTAPPVVALEDAAAIYRVEAALPRITPLVVREYAAPRPGTAGLVTHADTVLWQPVIVLPADGQTRLSFHLGAASGGYQVLIAGHTLDGRIGAVRGIIPVGPHESSLRNAEPGQTGTVPPPAP